jgi:hypothetical protein
MTIFQIVALSKFSLGEGLEMSSDILTLQRIQIKPKNHQ